MDNMSLFDTLHKCLKCGEDAYEVRPNEFECSSCEFIWEIVVCEEV